MCFCSRFKISILFYSPLLPTGELGTRFGALPRPNCFSCSLTTSFVATIVARKIKCLLPPTAFLLLPLLVFLPLLLHLLLHECRKRSTFTVPPGWKVWPGSGCRSLRLHRVVPSISSLTRLLLAVRNGRQITPPFQPICQGHSSKEVCLVVLVWSTSVGECVNLRHGFHSFNILTPSCTVARSPTTHHQRLRKSSTIEPAKISSNSTRSCQESSSRQDTRMPTAPSSSSTKKLMKMLSPSCTSLIPPSPPLC